MFVISDSFVGRVYLMGDLLIQNLAAVLTMTWASR